MQTNTNKLFLHAILLTWFVICLTIFIFVNRMGFVQIVNLTNWKAFVEMLAHISPLQYGIDLLSALLGVLLFSLACLSLGLCILQKWIRSEPSKLALGVTALLVGEILFSLIFLTVISLYSLTPTFVSITLSLGFLVGLPACKSFIDQLQPLFGLSTGFERSEKIILMLAVTSFILSLLLTSTRLGYDAASDYFSHAKIMAVSHLPIFFQPNQAFVVSEFHPGILYTALMQMIGDQSARLLSWVSGVIILLMGLAIGQEVGLTARARLWFLAIIATSTAFVDLLGDGKIELISTAPIVAGVYWLARSNTQPSKGTFTLIGFLSGFAIIARPYNIFLVSFFIFLFVVCQGFIKHGNNRSELKLFIRSVLWIIPPVLGLGIFHLIQNWIWLKNPIAPLVFAMDLKSSDWQWELNPANLNFYRILYPFSLTFLNSQQSLGNISPLLVGYLPFLLIRKVRENIYVSPLLGRLSIIASLTLILWITFSFTVLEIRYVLFLWIILFLITAKIMESAIQHKGTIIHPFLRPLLIVLLAILCVRTILIAVVTYMPLDSTKYYCPDSNLCKFMDTLNQAAAPGDRVFVLHAYRYYLRPDLFACSSRVDEYYPLEKLARQNSPEFWVDLYRRGYRYIMYEQYLSEFRYHFGKLPKLDTAPGWMNIKILYSNDKANQQIFQIEAVNPPVSPEISCQQNSEGIWQITPLSGSQSQSSIMELLFSGSGF